MYFFGVFFTLEILKDSLYIKKKKEGRKGKREEGRKEGEGREGFLHFGANFI